MTQTVDTDTERSDAEPGAGTTSAASSSSTTSRRSDRKGRKGRKGSTSGSGARGRVRSLLGRVRLLPSSRWTTVAATVLTVLLGLGAASHLVVERLTALPAGAVLRVGDTVVTEAEFQQRVVVLQALYGVTPPADAAAHDRFQRDAAQAVAATVVVDQLAAQRHVVVADPQVKSAVDKLISSFPQGQDGFTAALQKLHISEQAVADEIHRQLTTSALSAQVTAGIPPVSDADVQHAYDTRPDLSTVPEQRHLRNIVVQDQQKGQQVADQVRGGADFTALAAQNSVDASTSSTGGDLGFLSRDQVEQPVGDAAFTLPAGGVYGPVQTKAGWNVGQVAEIKPAQRLPLDQIHDQVRTRLDSDAHQQRWQSWLSDEFAHAAITYADDYRPANPGALPTTTP